MWAIRYIDPDVCAGNASEDTVVGICIILLTALPLGRREPETSRSSQEFQRFLGIVRECTKESMD